MKKYFNIRGGAGDLTKPDINTRPQDNLYLAVNSEWLSKSKIPADRTSTGINLILDMRIEDQLTADVAEYKGIHSFYNLSEQARQDIINK